MARQSCQAMPPLYEEPDIPGTFPGRPEVLCLHPSLMTATREAAGTHRGSHTCWPGGNWSLGTPKAVSSVQWLPGNPRDRAVAATCLLSPSILRWPQTVRFRVRRAPRLQMHARVDGRTLRGVISYLLNSNVVQLLHSTTEENWAWEEKEPLISDLFASLSH